MPSEIKAWKCDKCSKVWLDKQVADDCCKDKEGTNKCHVCGCDVNKPYIICSDCKEKERFEKAKKVKYNDYNVGCMWDENKDKYFWEKEDLEEDYYNDAFDNGEEPVCPEWCYGCTVIPFKVDIDCAIERASEDMHDEFENSMIVDLKELYEFVENWNKKQSAVTYYMDYNTVVLLNE